MFWDISLVCMDKYFPVDSNESYTDEDSINNIMKVAPRMDDVLYSTQWQDSTPTFTESMNKAGLCFTFNSLSHDELFTDRKVRSSMNNINDEVRSRGWTLEDGYMMTEDVNIMNNYPHRTAQEGFESRLSLILTSFTYDTDDVCCQGSEGYKIYLHTPIDVAREVQEYFLVSLGKSATIMVKPEVITTSESLRSFSPNERKCYYSNEKPLKFFRIYSENNCQTECNVDIIKDYCGCVPYYLPRDNYSLVCGLKKTACIKEIEKKIMHFKVLQAIKNQTSPGIKSRAYNIFEGCNCLPACQELKFIADVSHTQLLVSSSLYSTGLIGTIPGKYLSGLKDGSMKISSVDIFFKQAKFLALERRELYGILDFAANCGGLLGLFLGFSLLSCVEIIYFLTLRLCCRLKNNNI